MPHYYKAFLEGELQARIARNPKYSLRAMARDVGVDVAVLSKALGGKELLSVRAARRILEGLSANEEQARLFLESLAMARLDAPETQAAREASAALVEQDQFKVISDWFHYAILELTQVKGFKPRLAWIAKALGLEVIDARLAVERLVRLGLLRRVGRNLEKAAATVTTRDRGQTSNALKSYTNQILAMAQRANTDLPLTERAMFNMTMAIDPSKMPLAKKMIEEFCNEMTEVLGGKERRRVYQMHVNLFPLQKEMDHD